MYTASAADPVSDIEKVLPGWKIVWNGIQTNDANYAFIAVDPTGKNFGLAFRGSVPPFGSFSDWDVFANWVLEDLDVAVLRNWPYAQNTGARISEGAHIAFGNIMQMQDSLGSGKSIVDF
ncbi:hypothetical protein [Chitinophaga pinensis]|uniref:Uncharacterized protein n=1 Tax=Chitinophaga pinensis TaxID=79329 RepID=A0A5C6LU38_9BACT|nr:hypothetical protein [Chitinophaga pinensis]TWW00078.1 hypothetical protein FEF09_13885 [Chitinophaga pinensis]